MGKDLREEVRFVVFEARRADEWGYVRRPKFTTPCGSDNLFKD